MTQRHAQQRNCRTCRRPRPASSPGARPGAPPAYLDWPRARRARRPSGRGERFQTTLAVADLIHLEVVVDAIMKDNVEGDFMEAGVFRGGACIMLRGLLAAKRMCIAKFMWRTRSRASRRRGAPSRTCRRARSSNLISTRRLIGWIGLWPARTW